MFKKIIICMVCAVMLTACSGKESIKVSSLQKKDKLLNCKEVQLEINEAEFYRKTAERNKNPEIKTLLMPLGYISTYVDAEEAIGAADARVDYLNRIYDILDCDNPASRARSAANYNQKYMSSGGGYGGNRAGFAPAYYNAQQYSPKQQYYREQPHDASTQYYDNWYW